MKGLNESQLEFFRRGFAQNWINTTRKTPHGANMGGKLLNNNMKDDAARFVLGDEQYAALKEKASLEARMTESFNEVYGNSKTAERLQAAEDSKAQSAEEMFNVQFAPVEPRQWIKQQGANKIAQLLRRFDKDKRAEVARMLYSRNKDEAAAAIKLISENMDYAKKLADRYRTHQGAFGGGAGASASAQSNPGNISNISEEQGF
jgi:hypothetical protein